MDGQHLRARAERWRAAGRSTRLRARQVAALADIPWESPAADAYRRQVAARSRELLDLARSQESVAPLLDKVADIVDEAWRVPGSS